MAVRAIVAAYREFEQAARRSDISMAQYRLLLYLRTGPKRAGAIAAAAEISKPTLSLALNALREKGWVETATDPEDARVSRVVLTLAGKARMESFEEELARLFAQMGGGADIAAASAGLAQAYLAMGATKEARLKDLERRLTE